MDAAGSDLDPAYVRRRDEIALLAAGPDATPTVVDYRPEEHATWRTAKAALDDLWERSAATEILAARRRLRLPDDHLPQLTEVTASLRPRTGFEYRAVPGLVPVTTFFGALADGVFLSTQYVRHHKSPLYTPEPDVLHEVLGHATCLADPYLAMLHREAGDAMVRLETHRARMFVADVFWFSAEFGVVRQNGSVRAYGAGLLSSVGELEWFADNAQVGDLDIDRMGTLSYDISHFQPTLFAGDSLTHVLDVVGEFFAEATDDDIARRLAANASA